MKLYKLCIMCIPFLCLAIGCAKPKSSDYPMISPEKIVGMWLFDEEHDQIATDSSGNGHDGELREHPIRVPGKFGTALQFDGEGDAVVIPDFGESVPTSEVTVAAWVKLEEIKNHDLFSLVPISRVGHWRPDIIDRFVVHFPWNRPHPNTIHWQFGGETDLDASTLGNAGQVGTLGVCVQCEPKFHENLQKRGRGGVV